MVTRAPCPACRRKMSIEATACVRCGQPLTAEWKAKHTPPPPKPMTNTGRFMAFLCFLFVAIAVAEPWITEEFFMTEEERIESQKQRAEARAIRDARAAEIQLAAKNRGDHCREDNEMQKNVTLAIMNRLHDPYSYTIRNASMGPNKNGLHEYWVEFTANNRFGMPMINQAVVTINNSDCRIVSTRLINQT